MHVLFATTNKAKLGRMRALMRDTTIIFLSPTEEGLIVDETKEGSDIAHNAWVKALAYFGKTKLPILGQDAAFVIPGVDLDPAQVKRNALGNHDEFLMSQGEIAQAILNFYRALVRERGGRMSAYWDDAFALVFPDGTIREAQAKRPVILTDEIRGEMNPYFPLRSLYIVEPTGKYVCEQTLEEEWLELRPVREALRTLFDQ
ncbi:TPA: hypothetical protein DEP34_03090 [Candidatus Uhrbacteria bacterium]|uniref:HAM1/NUDIX domain-containing protein n=2 Tax=Candidatus Uhriibacteriota TaxID=1752732 RepID=A0A0G1T7G9_9BACT|nr:MAG: HAM1/NUDIX domain-containing protein [Candidatus Uhrbacteria bacterium GW2011_GWF2_46_218]KKU41375.1 MAG: HAM1/NUDIX domain-containing protein [Candidatus Uhrbacteria bacterium GW2011_GWE2_46_68]HBK33811.1 hypothetical protein [Candidatus Uhrbacteria bacterium]HCB19348.1 hypothetical protein [Candidatus Uhrbacteria bacterium]